MSAGRYPAEAARANISRAVFSSLAVPASPVYRKSPCRYCASGFASAAPFSAWTAASRRSYSGEAQSMCLREGMNRPSSVLCESDIDSTIRAPPN